MTLLVHPDFSVLGLLKFTVNLNCKAYSSQWLMSKITVYPQACMLGFFFSSLNSICSFRDICFKIKKCCGQVNTLKFGQSKSLFRASQVVLAIKNPPANAGRHKRQRFDPWVGKTFWSRAWQPTPVFLENPMDRGAWRATVHRVAKSGTRPKRLTWINQCLFNTTENGIEMILLF